MENTIVDILIKYSNKEEFCVAINPKLDEIITKNACKKVDKDEKTNKFLKLNCEKCNESIQFVFYFFNCGNQEMKPEIYQLKCETVDVQEKENFEMIEEYLESEFEKTEENIEKTEENIEKVEKSEADDSKTTRIRKKQKNYRTKRVMCHICSKEMHSSDIYEHIRTHSVSDGRPYSCAHCDKKFKTRCVLTTHLKIVHFKSLAKCKCHLCPAVFPRKQELDKHLFNRHQIGESPSVSCSFCNKILANSASLKYHIKSHHKDASERKKYECSHPKCGKIFFKTDHFKYHLLTHLPENKRPFKCFCGKGFSRRHLFHRHQLEHTDPNKLLVVCAVCGKSMKSAQSLKVHMRIHTGEQPYECSVCAKKFSDPGNHRVHLKQHEKELGLKLTFRPDERRLVMLNVLKAEQILENPEKMV